MNQLYFERRLLHLVQQRMETKWWKSNNSWQKVLRCSTNNVDLQIPAVLKVTPAPDSSRHRFSKTLSCQLCGKWAHLQKNTEDGGTEGQSVALTQTPFVTANEAQTLQRWLDIYISVIFPHGFEKRRKEERISWSLIMNFAFCQVSAYSFSIDPKADSVHSGGDSGLNDKAYAG